MNKIITNMQKLLQHAVGENIKFTTELHPNLTLTKIDAGQIQQTLLNLVINAKDAMPNGGKLVIRTYNTSEAAPESLPNKSLAKKEHIAIAITDTGCGMSKKVLDHLFEPFFSTKKQGERSGLGLSTAYGIIMQSNGLIDVKSAPNEGSTFTIYLPEAVTEEVTSPTQPAPATNTIETILLVEDEEMVRSLAEAILSRKGYNILSAENGEHALKLLKEYDGKINLLITDLIMPGIGGLKLAEKISTTHPETKLLFMSGYSEQNPLTEKKAFPDSGFLQKPFSLDQLTTKVMETINGTK